MKGERWKEVDFAYSGYNGRFASNYSKAKQLVNDGCYRVYYDDQAEFLAKIYGKKQVKGWSGNKIHETYAHLIAREYEAMIQKEQRNNSTAQQRTRLAPKITTKARTRSKPKTTSTVRKPTRKPSAPKSTAKKATKKQ